MPKPTPTITWEEPMIPKRSRRPIQQAEPALRTNPGRWARIECNGVSAYTFCKRNPDFECKVINHRKPDEAVYVRYIGTEACA